ncbi:MAG: thioredoxin family protein [Hyphomicrobiales bacterium]|nr:thioredoxin family protein [Hyphomicrobiales bacterium]MCP5000340.1 thioredoxin family protein [Hyphomicrobiales bacterium]
MASNSDICEFGWKAPDFSLQDPHGKPHAMADYIGPNGLLIMFICNHCPYVKAIAERLATDSNELMENGVGVLAIMSNDYNHVAEDNPENMVLFAQRYGFKFPYLVDEDQSVGRVFDAKCTPDFFGFNSLGELQYRGRLDDARHGNADNRVRELVNAMNMIAETGNGPRDQTPSIGCSIKWRAT